MKKLSKKSPIYVICDSREALSLAFKDGLSEKYKVLTSSPSMILNEKYSNLESLWKEKKIRNFLSSIENNRRKIFNKLYKNKNISHEEAFIVAIQITEYYKTIYKAACLSKKILNSDILYIKAEGYGGRKNIDLNPPWEEILNFKRNFTFKSFIIKKKENKKPNIFEKIKSMHYKLQLLGLDGFLFRLIKKNKILNIFKRDIVFLLGENELLEETTTSMFFKGFKIQTFDDRYNFSDQNKENLSVIRKIINNDIFSITSDWVNKEIISSCEKIFFNNLFSSLGRYYQSKKSAENFLLKYKNKKKILFNARYINPKVLGILSVFKSFKIPVVSFQHGVTPEISDFKTDHGLYSPGNCSDLFLYFNKAITRIADSEDYIKSKAAVVGLPYKYYRASKIKSCFTPSKSKILYLSMNLYKGYFGANNGYINDLEKAKQECYFVQKVLGDIPYYIDYKPYIVENLRYFDNDPVFEIIKNTKNVKLLDHNIDARYILSAYKLIITTSASSTLSWCIMSQVPLIFINDIRQSPLKKSLHNKVKNSVFYFDKSNKHFISDFRDLLSNSLKEISFMYQKKRKKRDALIKNYFGKYQKNAGKRSAKYIIKKYFC